MVKSFTQQSDIMDAGDTEPQIIPSTIYQAKNQQRVQKLEILTEELISTMGEVFHVLTGKRHINEKFLTAAGVDPKSGMLYVKLAPYTLKGDALDLDSFDGHLESDLDMFFHKLTRAAGNNDEMSIDPLNHKPATLLTFESPFAMLDVLDSLLKQERHHDLGTVALPLEPDMSINKAFAQATTTLDDIISIKNSLGHLRVYAQNILHPLLPTTTENAVYRLH
ncbi:MAG: hypothetical protein AAB276_08340 [Pseudomonadota bacterium]